MADSPAVTATAARPRVLFVDDEPLVLSALRRSLERRKVPWDTTFAVGPVQARAILEKAPFDVVVSDLVMPEEDGARFLAWVQSLRPDTIRIMLTGGGPSVLRATAVAHQVLPKPTEAAELENVISRAYALRDAIRPEVIRQAIGDVEALPAAPRTYAALVAKLNEPMSTPEDFARIVERDPAVSAKLLQIVNSAFFGAPTKMANVKGAVVFLGVNTLRQLVLSIEAFRGMTPDRARQVEALHRHSLLVGSIARAIVDDRDRAEDAFTAGILHDVGLLVLMTKVQGYVGRMLVNASDGKPVHTAERALLGLDHGEVGGYLLGLWGLPYPVVEAVACHHNPSRVTQVSFDVVAAVHVADQLAHEVAPPLFDRPEQSPLDEAYVDRLGQKHNLARWRNLAQRLAETLPSLG